MLSDPGEVRVCAFEVAVGIPGYDFFLDMRCLYSVYTRGATSGIPPISKASRRFDLSSRVEEPCAEWLPTIASVVSERCDHETPEIS